MTGNDTVHISLTIEQWRETYRILHADQGGWNRQLRTIEDACKRNQLTIPLTVAQTWTMSSTVRETNPELADAIKAQLAWQTALCAFAN